MQGAPPARIPGRASLSPPAAALLPAAAAVLVAIGTLGAVGLGALGLCTLGCAATRAGSTARPLAPPVARAPGEPSASERQAADQRAAADRYRQACEAGQPLGCYNLGMVEATGLGAPRDLAAAARHFA
ncbi:MAG TPA: hypothetical protein VJA16_09475, partial [Thermoanaerobaculia bacterium]